MSSSFQAQNTLGSAFHKLCVSTTFGQPTFTHAVDVNRGRRTSRHTEPVGQTERRRAVDAYILAAGTAEAVADTTSWPHEWVKQQYNTTHESNCGSRKRGRLEHRLRQIVGKQTAAQHKATDAGTWTRRGGRRCSWTRTGCSSCTGLRCCRGGCCPRGGRADTRARTATR